MNARVCDKHVTSCCFRHLKGEVFAANDEMLEQKDALFRSELRLVEARQHLALSQQ